MIDDEEDKESRYKKQRDGLIKMIVDFGVSQRQVARWMEAADIKLGQKQISVILQELTRKSRKLSNEG